MVRRSLRARFTLCFGIVVLALVAVPLGIRALRRPAVAAPIPAGPTQARVADFAAPLSADRAAALVAAAQRAENQHRAELAQKLGAISPDALPLAQTLFVAETNHHLSDRTGFLTFWRERGGALVFGYPVGEEIVENGQIVQYFERARFEYHPERLGQNGQVQLSLLGRELTAGRNFPDGAPDGGAQYFPETKHTLSGKFLKYWLKRGGLPIFGFPISEPFEEPGADGQNHVTQYFERARFEYHP